MALLLCRLMVFWAIANPCTAALARARNSSHKALPAKLSKNDTVKRGGPAPGIQDISFALICAVSLFARWEDPASEFESA